MEKEFPLHWKIYELKRRSICPIAGWHKNILEKVIIMKRRNFSFFSKRSIGMILSVALLIAIFVPMQTLTFAQTTGMVQNGDFENGLTCYGTSEKAIVTVEADKGRNNSNGAVLGAADGAYNNAFLYQEVAVKANTNYVWSFWFKCLSNNNKLVGVRTENGEQLLPSEINTESGSIVAEHKSFNNLRNTSAPANWHQGMDVWDGKWHEYKVSFNTGDQTKVLLTINMFFNNRNGITDDWAVCEDPGIGKLVNGDFENDLYGWETTDKIIATVESGKGHNESKGAVLGATNSAYGKAYIYQAVEVDPNTNYVWSFWFCSVSSNDKFMGVRTEDGTQLLPSLITTETGDINNGFSKFDTIRSASEIGNWHAGCSIWDGKWHEYKVSFNTGDQTKVLLTINMFFNNRNGITDDWAVCEDPGIGKLVNGDFENDLYGWETTDKIIATVESGKGHNESKGAVLGATNSAYGKAYIYQAVEVDPNTNYVWSFWFCSVSSNDKFMGVRTEDGTQLLPSLITTETGDINNGFSKFDTIRSASEIGNWHAGCSIWDGKWHEYKVSFNTGDQTKVLLTMDMFYNNRNGRTDDWALAERVEIAGDANEDGMIDSTDLAVIRKKLLDSNTEYSNCLDANEDGIFDIRDLIAVKKKLVNTSAYAGYALVWEDNFNGTSLNKKKWDLIPHMAEQPDLELRYDDTAVKVNDGNVMLTSGRVEEVDDKYYTNASLTTSKTMAFKYGYVEMRAKVPFGKPAFPSFWMKSAEICNSTEFGEIDIFECFANDTEIESAIHKWGESHISSDAGKYSFPSKIAAENWHTYGLLWVPGQLKFLVDGAVFGTIDTTGKEYYVDDYYYLIINNYLYTKSGISKDGCNASASDAFPINYEIDYVRLYQKAGEGVMVKPY